MANVYSRNFIVALRKAAKSTGVAVDEIRLAYRNSANASDEVKKAVNMAHSIMRGYSKTAAPAEPTEAPAAEAVAG